MRTLLAEATMTTCNAAIKMESKLVISSFGFFSSFTLLVSITAKRRDTKAKTNPAYLTNRTDIPFRGHSLGSIEGYICLYFQTRCVNKPATTLAIQLDLSFTKRRLDETRASKGAFE